MRRACVFGLLLGAAGVGHASPLFVTRTLSSESGCTADRLELRAIEFRHAAATDVGASERYLVTNAQGAARFLRPNALRPGTDAAFAGQAAQDSLLADAASIGDWPGLLSYVRVLPPAARGEVRFHVVRTTYSGDPVLLASSIAEITGRSCG